MSIHNAAESGNLNRVRTLLNQGMSVNLRDSFGYTPLYWAANKNRLNVVKELLNRGAKKNARDWFGHTALFAATRSGHLNVVKELLNRGANKNARDSSGHTPLHIAAHRGNLNIVKELLRRGARVNPRNSNGFIPLHLVGQRPRVAHELIKAGANPKYTNKWEETPYNRAQNNVTRNAVRTSRAASKWLKPIRKRKAERMLMSPRLLGSVLPNNAIRSISKYLTIKKKNNNK